jgi:lipid II:glycine glycyltransferase (peptidoglycan interpeptide bridge formation enzyme)
LVILQGGRTAHYKFGASDAGFLHLRPNELAMWHAIRQSLHDDMTRYHFGRTSVGNSGLRKFKAGFGARETALGYWKFDLATDRTVAAPDRANGWTNHIIKHLPQCIVNAIGGTLYRHLS